MAKETWALSGWCCERDESALMKRSNEVRQNCNSTGWETGERERGEPIFLCLINRVHLLPQPTTVEGKTENETNIWFVLRFIHKVHYLFACVCVYLSIISGVWATSVSCLSNSSPVSHFSASSTESAVEQQILSVLKTMQLSFPQIILGSHHVLPLTVISKPAK